MYAKTLVPGTRPVAALMATTDEAEVLVPQLVARGWVPFGDPLGPGAFSVFYLFGELFDWAIG